jgi:hypothetical protein
LTSPSAVRICIILPIEKKDVPMTRKRGNPNWGNGRFPRILALPTAFDKQVHRLGLNEQTCATSEQLAQWRERNKNLYYVPEKLLKQWGMTVDANVSG